MAHEKFAVTLFADLAAWLLPFGIDATSRVHSLLVSACFTIVVSAELAKVHLRGLFEDEISAALTFTRAYLFPVRTLQVKDRVFLVHIELIFADSHGFFTPY